jgi:hypothetical protein
MEALENIVGKDRLFEKEPTSLVLAQNWRTNLFLAVRGVLENKI